MDKIKRIINVIVPMTICNLKCHYCYLSQTESFDKNIPKLEYDLDTIKECLTLQRLGGPCIMNLCAVGETLMAPYIVELSKNLLENGNYVTIVTNGTIEKKIKEFTKISSDLKKHLFFKFSYQYLELKRLNMLDTFFKNIKLIKDNNISFSIELTANDESIKFIEDLKELCKKNVGFCPHIIESRNNNDGFKKLTKLKNDEHMENWKKFDSPLIEFQDKIWGEKRKEFCYAGDWIFTLYLQNGNIAPCFGGGPIIQNIFENPNEPIHFKAIGCKCPWSHCYAAYVLLTLGAIPELDTPLYSELRNRIDKNGKECLQKEMKYFMSSKFIESNVEYNQDAKNIINWIREMDFNNTVMSEIKYMNSLENLLINKNIKNIGMVFDEKYVKNIINILKPKKIKLKFFIYMIEEENIRKKSSIKSKLKYIAKKIIKMEKTPTITQYDEHPKVDAIICFDIDKYMLYKKYSNETNIILVTDLWR